MIGLIWGSPRTVHGADPLIQDLMSVPRWEDFHDAEGYIIAMCGNVQPECL